MEIIYDDLKRALIKLQLANHQNVNNIVSIDNGEVTAIVDPENLTRKLAIKLIKKELIKLNDEFRFKLIFKGTPVSVTYPSLTEKIKRIDFGILYRNVFYRASVLSFLFISGMTALFYYVKLDSKRVDAVGDQLLDVSALISAFIITYLTSKILSIRQEKIASVPKILDLSSKLSDFRRICKLILESWRFWQPSRIAWNHGKMVAGKIDFNDLHYLDSYGENYRYVNGLMDYAKYGEVLPKFVLQLATLCHSNDRNINTTVFYGLDFSSKYVYSHKELKKIQFLQENNLFWYVFENEKQDYENSFDFNLGNHELSNIQKCAIRINGSFAKKEFNREYLIEISRIAENEIIPELTRLINRNESKLPFLIKYLLVCFSLVFIFGVFAKLILGVFTDSMAISYFSMVTVASIVVHILICMPTILEAEIRFSPKNGYD